MATALLGGEALVTRHEKMAQVQPPDYSLPLSFLPTSDGFACTYDGCSNGGVRGRSRKALRLHLNEEHAARGEEACVSYIRRVYLQTWFSRSRKLSRFWIVTGSGLSYPDRLSPSLDSGRDVLRARLEDEEQRRLATLEQDQQGRLGHSSNPQVTETTLWLQHTQWPQQFAHRPLSVIAAAAAIPKQPRSPNTTKAYVLGVWEGSDVVSPAEDEVRLLWLVRSLDAVFDRCLRTLDATPFHADTPKVA